MKFGHLHIQFQNLDNAVRWMKTVLEVEPVYANAGMAVFQFEHTSLIFDKADTDSAVTIAFDSEDCEKDFARLQSRGAVVTEAPTKQPWGVMAAYFQGPGKAFLELEQMLK